MKRIRGYTFFLLIFRIRVTIPGMPGTMCVRVMLAEPLEREDIAAAHLLYPWPEERYHTID
jgi:hypothetical protein